MNQEEIRKEAREIAEDAVSDDVPMKSSYVELIYQRILLLLMKQQTGFIKQSFEEQLKNNHNTLEFIKNN